MTSDRPDPSERRDPREYLDALELEKLPELLPVSEISTRLGLGRQRIYELLHTGELSGIKTGPGGLRVFRRSLLDYLRRSLI